MTVWAFNTPQGEGEVDFVYSSLKKGTSRYGWSYMSTVDLHVMKNKDGDELNESEIDCWKRGHFLLEIEKGDWVVHINVPEYGQCTAAKVIEPYKFDPKKNKLGVGDYSDGGDFRHTIGIDIDTLITFDRNNENITPFISRRLKLQGAHWRIYDTDEFLISIENYKNNAIYLSDTMTHGMYYLREDVKSPLSEITKAIQKNHPGKKLEEFIAMVFKNVPNVIDVKLNGSGFGTDHGADIIVTFNTGLPITGLQQEAITVVQIKSYTGVHWSNEAVEQIQNAIKKYEASSGLIITTGEVSDDLLKSVEKAQNKIKKPIILIAGKNVATFVLKYGAEYVF